MPLPCDSVTILSEGMRSVQVWPDRPAHLRNDPAQWNLALSALSDLDGRNCVLRNDSAWAPDPFGTGYWSRTETGGH